MHEKDGGLRGRHDLQKVSGMRDLTISPVYKGPPRPGPLHSHLLFAQMTDKPKDRQTDIQT